ncbi:hypothetical protein D3C71_1874530 [compost metagenome]
MVVGQLHQVRRLLGLDGRDGFLFQRVLRTETTQLDADLVLLFVVLLGQFFELGLVCVRQRVPDLNFYRSGIRHARQRHGGAEYPCTPAGEHRAGNTRQLQILHRFTDQEKGIPVLAAVR